MQLGMRHALQHGFESVITMDADGQHEVQEIAVLLAASEQADVVIGAHIERASWMRRLAWRWFRTLAGFELQDLTSGFRLYNRHAIRTMASSEATLLDYQDIGVLMMLRQAGLAIVEVPVKMSPRQAGHSRIFASWFSVLSYMVVTTVICVVQRPSASQIRVKED
jgi:hypothetical protein